MSAYQHVGTDDAGLSMYRETPGPVIVVPATTPLKLEPFPAWVDVFGLDTRKPIDPAFAGLNLTRQGAPA